MSDAKELLSARIAPVLMKEIKKLAIDKERSLTSVVEELLQRGAETVKDAPLESEKFVSEEKFAEFETRFQTLESALADVQTEMLEKPSALSR